MTTPATMKSKPTEETHAMKLKNVLREIDKLGLKLQINQHEPRRYHDCMTMSDEHSIDTWYSGDSGHIHLEFRTIFISNRLGYQDNVANIRIDDTRYPSDPSTETPSISTFVRKLKSIVPTFQSYCLNDHVDNVSEPILQMLQHRPND